MGTPGGGLRNIFGTLLATAALLATTVAPTLADPKDDPRLTLTTQLSSALDLTATGTLVAGNRPLRGAEIVILLDGSAVQKVATTQEGTFSFAFSMRDRGTSEHTLTAAFHGSGGPNKPAEATASIEIPQTPASQLTGSISASNALTGDVVEIRGKLATNAGTPISGGLITFQVGGRADANASTPTGPDGSFFTVVQLPDAAGKAQLVASYGGSSVHEPATVSWTVAVSDYKETPASPPPTPSETPSASPSATTSDAQIATATMAPTLIRTNADASGPGVPWLLFGMIALAVFGTLITVGMVYRGRATTAAEGPGDSLLSNFTDEGGTPPPPARRTG